MENNSYEEYIRSVLGYPNNTQEEFYQDYNYNQNLELEACYPEIYNVVYPMVRKACQNFNGTITNEEIDRMVDDLYYSLEGPQENRTAEVKTNKIQNAQEIRTFNGKRVIAEPVRETKKEVSKTIEPRETRTFKPKNCAMCDLIKILLLRELIGEPGKPPYRPQVPGRPPFPPPGRPPFRPF